MLWWWRNRWCVMQASYCKCDIDFVCDLCDRYFGSGLKHLQIVCVHSERVYWLLLLSEAVNWQVRFSIYLERRERERDVESAYGRLCSLVYNKIYRRRKYTNVLTGRHIKGILYTIYNKHIIKDHPDLVPATELNWIFLLGLLFEFVYNDSV